MKHGHVGQNIFIMKNYTHQTRTRKPQKTVFRENGVRVPPTNAMVQPLGF